MTTSTSTPAARIDGNEIIVIGRRGGPEFVDAELARFGHLVSLAAARWRGRIPRKPTRSSRNTGISRSVFSW